MRLLSIAAVIALGSSAVLSQTVPPMPDKLVVPADNTLFLQGHAVGTQNYICLPSATGFAWTFYSPQATLFFTFKLFGRDVQQQIITHFLSPNPEEDGLPRATWQSSIDSSEVWAKAIETSSDANFVAAGAIPWLKLQRVGSQRGPTGGDGLTGVTFIQRLNTAGGVAPSAGCSEAANVGAKAMVPYSADYFFYRLKGRW
jgi:hypothetical protein